LEIDLFDSDADTDSNPEVSHFFGAVLEAKTGVAGRASFAGPAAY